jgi:O-antigen/teichoic acid export membrane protein
MLGQVINLMLQAAYFIFLARLLGVVSYGLFAGVFALVNVVTPYSALGSAMLFMRYVSADPEEARVFWGNTILTILLVSLLLGAGLLAIAPRTIGPSNQLLIVTLVIANCVMSQVVNCASLVFLTFRMPKSAAVNRFLSNLLRAAILLVMLLTLKTASATLWGFGVLISSGIAAAISLIWVYRTIGSMRFDLSHLRKHLKEGLGFAFAGSTESVYNDLDKILLTHYHMNAASGIYTMAYRVVDFATAPIHSIVASVMPRWFVLSKEGYHRVADALPKLLKVCLIAGVAAAVSVFLASPFIVRMAGHGFGEAIVAMRWLCWLPIFRAVQHMAGSVLTATGLQSIRTTAQFTTGVFNAGLNIWLIPHYGWRGAAWASLLSDGLLGLANLLLVFYFRRSKPLLTLETAAYTSELV